MIDYKELLTELLSSLNISKKKFAEQLGLSQGNVSDWFNRPGYRPSIDALKRISDTFNVNLNWLVTGEGHIYNVPAPARVNHSSVISLPVVADIAAGTGIEAYDLEPEEYISIDSSLLPVRPAWVFRVSGSSMEPEILTGDYAIIAPFDPDQDYDGTILAFRSLDGLLPKRFTYDHRRKRAILIPLNPRHPLIQYDQSSSDIIMLGPLIAIIRKYL